MLKKFQAWQASSDDNRALDMESVPWPAVFPIRGRPRQFGTFQMIAQVVEDLPEGGDRLRVATTNVLELAGGSVAPSLPTKSRIKSRLLSAGLKGVEKPNKTTAVRDEAERSAAALLSLAGLHKSHAHLPRGAKLGADATGILYGINKDTGKLDLHLVHTRLDSIRGHAHVYSTILHCFKLPLVFFLRSRSTVTLMPRLWMR